MSDLKPILVECHQEDGTCVYGEAWCYLHCPLSPANNPIVWAGWDEIEWEYEPDDEDDLDDDWLPEDEYDDTDYDDFNEHLRGHTQ